MRVDPGTLAAMAASSPFPSTSPSTSTSTSSSSGLTFKLHPLVIVNISDHYTRVKAQQRGTPSRVIGCVLGCQTGRTVEIFNSFELKFHDAVDAKEGTGGGGRGGAATGGGGADGAAAPADAAGGAAAAAGTVAAATPILEDGGESIIDKEFLNTKIEQYKKVFPKYDVLGWYSTGAEVHAADMLIHKTIMEVNESPIFVLLNPTINPAGKDLPISIFESELHVIDGSPSMIFVNSTYTIETVEAERISVDHVAHIKPSDGSSTATQLAAHLTGMHSAIKMLSSRIRVLHHLLAAMHRGEVACDHNVLRQVASLMRRLPAVDSLRFQQDLLTEHNDTLLMAYMASITKGTNLMNELVEKFNVAYDKQSRKVGRGTFM